MTDRCALCAILLVRPPDGPEVCAECSTRWRDAFPPSRARAEDRAEDERDEDRDDVGRDE